MIWILWGLLIIGGVDGYFIRRRLDTLSLRYKHLSARTVELEDMRTRVHSALATLDGPQRGEEVPYREQSRTYRIENALYLLLGILQSPRPAKKDPKA